METILIDIDFEKMNGLAPAIVQDSCTKAVLMLGFVNAESLEQTLRSGFVTFYSRTRRQLWTKGETSGNKLRVVLAQTDCDRDTVLFHVQVEGGGNVCHTGAYSCFEKAFPLESAEALPGAPR